MAEDCDEDIGEFLSLLGDEFEGVWEPIEGDGYCFFAALVRGLAWEAESSPWRLYMLALVLLWEVHEVHAFVSFPEGWEEVCRAYIVSACPELEVGQLDGSQVYVLHKLLHVHKKSAVLDGPYWGDAPEMAALGHMLGVKILVIPVPFQGSVTILGREVEFHEWDINAVRQSLPMHAIVLLHRRGNHYDLLRLNETDTPLQCASWEALVQSCHWRMASDLPAGPTRSMLLELKAELAGNSAPRGALDPETESVEAEMSESNSEVDSLSSDDVSGEMGCRCWVYEKKTWQTDEDKMEKVVQQIAVELREWPLLPVDPRDPDLCESWTDVGGICLPLAHCAFRGCGWWSDDVKALHGHLCSKHGGVLSGKRHSCYHERNVCNENMALYCAAIREKEQEHVPVVGPSIDRRAIRQLNVVCNDERLQMLVCACCATKKVYGPGSAVSELEVRKGAELLQLGLPVLEVNFGMDRFRRLYGRGPQFAEDEDLQAGGKIKDASGKLEF